jgi:hypothetical protein
MIWLGGARLTGPGFFNLAAEYICRLKPLSEELKSIDKILNSRL